MTAALVAFAAGVGTYAPLLRRFGPGPAAALSVNALATLAIAATPLDGPAGGRPHAVAAALAYGSLAATPLLAAVPMRREGRKTAAVLSASTGALVAALLTGSVLAAGRVGLLQRSGLTLGDIWVAGSAVAVLIAPRRQD
jgi:hypothetical protein